LPQNVILALRAKNGPLEHQASMGHPARMRAWIESALSDGHDAG
jgi:hypothetical protein